MAETKDMMMAQMPTALSGAAPLALSSGPVPLAIPSATPLPPDEGWQDVVPASKRTEIKGRFNQYQSGYWVLAVPLLAARYLAEGINEIFKPLRIIHRLDRKIAEMTQSERKAVVEKLEEVSRSKKGIDWKEGVWVLGVAAGMSLITGFYTSRTYGDMKRQFAEPVGWELDKDPRKVGIIDMARSKNMLVRDAVSNLASRTLMRFAAHAPFVAFFAGTPFKNKSKFYKGYAAEIDSNQILHGGKEGYDVEVEKVFSKLTSPKGALNLAVGTESAYLASDALLRKRTFFEELQTFIDTKINHTDRAGEKVTASDLLGLYDRAARNTPAVHPLPKMNTPQWQEDQKLFARMAELMNKTYGNTPNTEKADFTVSKLIYMLGTRLLKTEDPAKNMAYLELANRHGIKAVEKVAAVANGHGDLGAALEAYPDIAGKIVETEQAAQAPARQFASDTLRASRPEVPAASQVDKLAQALPAAGMAAGVG